MRIHVFAYVLTLLSHGLRICSGRNVSCIGHRTIPTSTMPSFFAHPPIMTEKVVVTQRQQLKRESTIGPHGRAWFLWSKGTTGHRNGKRYFF
ncbi:hypothetical protein QBC45DRAFT_405732 [Copromyces sp. CBS 386.78]|nr:hypothetical protein QBC45DRAFT_405732 [Copromyces sp. CBS 386.78]